MVAFFDRTGPAEDQSPSPQKDAVVTTLCHVAKMYPGQERETSREVIF